MLMRSLAVLVLVAAPAFAQEPIRFARTPDISPDGKLVAFSYLGDLWTVEAIGGVARPVAMHEAHDYFPCFSPDGRRIAFSSNRHGQYDVYVVPVQGGKPTRLTFDSAHEYVTGWTPDGKNVVFSSTRSTGYPFTPEAYTIPAAGGQERRLPLDEVKEAYFAPNGKQRAYVSGAGTWSRRGYRGSSNDDLWLGGASPLAAIAASSSDIDWDDIHLRVTRPASMSADSGVISPDGSMVAFRHLTNGDDLWVANADGGGVGRITSGDQAPRFIQWSKKTPGTIFFLNKAGELRATRANLGFTGPSGPSGDPMKFAFSATLNVRRAEEYAEMFAQSWRLLADGYYDATHHGTDWKAIREKYAPLVGHVAAKEDLYALISLMLGELNSSHLGIGGKLPTPDEPTADLGLVFDETHRGLGMKIADVLKRGPADKRGLGLRAGDVILAIDRTELAGNVNVSRLLNGKVGEAVTLDVTGDPTDPRARRQVEIVASPRNRISQLMYDRWVAKNAEQVSKQSNGTIGYIHVPSMDEDGLEAFVRSLYSDNFDKDAVILDVRYNSGGFTHDAVLNYLSGKEHTVFRQRNGGEGLVFRNYDRKWTKPAAVVVNSRSYSDAEIFPHAFRSMGLGKVIGQATGGQVIGTGEVKLIDGSWFNLPRTGIFTVRGVNMEKEGVVPDVAVELDPTDRVKGIDTQLTKSVEVLKADVVAWKKARGVTPPAGGGE